MSARDQQRIIALQSALRHAKTTLERVKAGCRVPDLVAEDALYEIMKIELQSKPTPVVDSRKRQVW